MIYSVEYISDTFEVKDIDCNILATIPAILDGKYKHYITHGSDIVIFACNGLYIVWSLHAPNEDFQGRRSFHELGRCVKIDAVCRSIRFQKRNGTLIHTDYHLNSIKKAAPYIYTGRCIWCHKSSPDVTFDNEPHIIPQSMGAREIGIDVCDSCNRYFGNASKYSRLNTNLVFKEVFSPSLMSLGERNLVNKTKPHLVYFEYDRTTDRIKIKRPFPVYAFTKTFKQSLYEVFLQKYHACYPDENLDKFEAVRVFARYGEGDLKVFFAINYDTPHF